ncbi:MAG TPA: hypothetical protein DFS52_32485, partial [Myxococcales bacterium]|nr:hypothetical protein [Myxococcales bacterium]
KLPFSTVFKVSVATSLKRARDGGPLPVAVGWGFRTVHPPMLRVEQVEPADGASGVARDAVVRVRFSEPVSCASLENGNAVLTETFDPHPHTAEGELSRAIAGSWECPAVEASADATLDGTQCEGDESLCVVTFKPSDETFLFKYSSDLKLVLKGGTHAENPIVTARATPYGGQLPATVETGWHVIDPAPLTAVATMPGAGSGQVARDASLLVTFSEPIDCATLADGFVSLQQKFDAHPRLGELAGATVDV